MTVIEERTMETISHCLPEIAKELKKIRETLEEKEAGDIDPNNLLNILGNMEDK